MQLINGEGSQSAWTQPRKKGKKGKNPHLPKTKTKEDYVQYSTEVGYAVSHTHVGLGSAAIDRQGRGVFFAQVIYLVSNLIWYLIPYRI